MRSMDEMINSGKTLTRKEAAAVERYLWSSCEVLSLGDENTNLTAKERKEKVKWYKTWSKQ